MFNHDSMRSHAAFITVVCLVLALVLYALTWDLRPFPVLSWVDDYRYVLSALHLKHGEWLGPFDATTLVKRPFFSVVLAVTSALHIPFLPFRLFFYLAAVGFFAHALLKLGLPRWGGLALCIVLALIPILYDANGSRVLRENVAMGLELIMLSVALGLLCGRMAGVAELLTRATVRRLGLLYLLVAFHWGLREEAAIFDLSLSLLLVAVAFLRLNEWRARLLAAAVLCTGMALAVGATSSLISVTNYWKYGVYLVNDLSEGTFPGAMTALRGVTEGGREDLLLAPEEVEKLLDKSPHFRVVGKGLRGYLKNAPRPDYSHSVFILRVGTLRDLPLGSSATATQAYFRELAAEVQRLCARGELRCEPQHLESYLPSLSRSQWSIVPRHLANLAGYLLYTRASGFDFPSSKTAGMEPTPAVVLEHFRELTRQELFGWDGVTFEFSQPASAETLRRQQWLRESIATAYELLGPCLYALGAACMLLLLVRAVRRREWLWSAVLLAPLALVVGRLLVLSYLGAIDDRVPPRVMSPAYPFGLACVVISICVVLARLPQTLHHHQIARTTSRSEAGEKPDDT